MFRRILLEFCHSLVTYSLGDGGRILHYYCARHWVAVHKNMEGHVVTLHYYSITVNFIRCFFSPGRFTQFYTMFMMTWSLTQHTRLRTLRSAPCCLEYHITKSQLWKKWCTWWIATDRANVLNWHGLFFKAYTCRMLPAETHITLKNKLISNNEPSSIIYKTYFAQKISKKY